MENRRFERKKPIGLVFYHPKGVGGFIAAVSDPSVNQKILVDMTEFPSHLMAAVFADSMAKKYAKKSRSYAEYDSMDEANIKQFHKKSFIERIMQFRNNNNDFPIR